MGRTIDKLRQSKIISKKVKWEKIIIVFSIITLFVLAWVKFTKAGYIPNFLKIPHIHHGPDFFYEPCNDDVCIKKPVIYLYPQQKQDIIIRLNYHGEIIADYPRYDKSIKGWRVTAYPDGKIINHVDGKEYSYLFWEGKPEKQVNWDFSKGFVVKGKDVREFLQKKLAKIGLTPKEYNEFIVYWYPLMQDNKYNLIHFVNEQYTKTAPLKIIPKPDSVLRVFMVYKPLNKMIKIEEQKIEPFKRKGFVVVEWGGAKAK